MFLLLAATPAQLSGMGIAIDAAIISRYANAVSKTGIVFGAFLRIIITQTSCVRSISGTAWSRILIFLHKVDARVRCAF